MANDDVELPSEALRTLTCLTEDDDLVRRIRTDLAAEPSVLALMKRWVGELEGELDNDALPFRKLRRLFELGSVPERIEGHHYGITLGLRTGDLRGTAAQYGNLLGYLWGKTVGGVCPWVGKSFAPIAPAEVDRLARGAIRPGAPVFRGINHFHALERAPFNVAANAVLEIIWRLGSPPAAEAARFGHERNGGHFLAYRARSVHESTPREVFRLNYRFPALENSPPLPALIDEVVEIAKGLYLGQLLFATDRPFEEYDPARSDADYHYQHFGYFLIFAEGWNAEARRLFPHLGAPPPAAAPARSLALSLADPPGGPAPLALSALRDDLAGSPTMMHLLLEYSDALRRNPSTDAPEFAKLEAMFAAGEAPGTMSGYFRGASVTFQSHGLLAALGVNELNVSWRLARHFSPWTGKRFDPIEPGRLAELTGGQETAAEGTSFGSNTVVFRTVKEKLVRTTMEVAGMWIIDATEDERRRDGYDARTFFFIGKPAKSIVPESAGKEVYQFNYRWKALRSPPPDYLCVDEIVRIAEGLYLGKLLYATDVLRGWDPKLDPAKYRYRLFGYFLLMDQAWHELRVRLGFDLDNT